MFPYFFPLLLRLLLVDLHSRASILHIRIRLLHQCKLALKQWNTLPASLAGYSRNCAITLNALKVGHIHLINNSRRVTSVGEWVFVSIQN